MGSIIIDPKHLSRIEVGKSYPSLDTLEKIANVLKVEIKDLFGFMHKTGSKEVSKNISTLLKEAGEDEQQIILKIINLLFSQIYFLGHQTKD